MRTRCEWCHCSIQDHARIAKELGLIVGWQCETAEAEIARLSSQLAGLRTASEAFLAKWPLVLTKINGVFALQHVRSGVSYKGPTIGAEIDALTAALAAASQERDTTTPTGEQP